MEKSEIAKIFNRYKGTLDDLIDTSDIKSLAQPYSLDLPELIDKRLCNAFRSRNGSQTFSNEDCLNDDISVVLLELASTIRDSKVYPRNDIAFFGPKSGRVQYRKA